MIKSLKLVFIRLIFLTTFVACTVGPDFKHPQLSMPKQYTTNGVEEFESYNKINQVAKHNTNGVNFEYNKHLQQQWWQLFHSKQIDSLVSLAIKNNYGLEASRATLRQAQQNLNSVAGSQLPQVGMSAAATPTRVSPAVYGFGDFPSNDFVLYNASVNVSYNLDLFGGLKRQAEAAGALVEYQAYQLQGAQIALSTNITTTLFHLALLNEQIATSKLMINAQESMLLIVKQQFEIGSVTSVDINNAEQLVLQGKANLTDLEKSLYQLHNQLAVYLGLSPFEATKIIQQLKLPHLKLSDFTQVKDIPVMIPSDLLKSRPDILAAEALLHQASAQVGVATANMYPQLNITASGGPIATQSAWNTLNAQSWIWSFGPGLTIPLFNGGSLNAQRKAAIAGFEQSLLNYKQTVLSALQNVADCLNALQKDDENLDIKEQYYTKYMDNLLILQQQYLDGGASYVQLLNGQLLAYQGLIAKLQAQTLKLSDTVALFQSTGSVW